MTTLEATASFRHEAVLYEGLDGFVARIAPFIAGGVSAGEPTLVMTNARKIAALRERLDGTDGRVEYQDMEVVGANPARIIPAWDDFATRQARTGATRFRGVGEPIWAGRAAAELEECHWHEALINRAFAKLPGFWLVCPYDVQALAAGVVRDAHHTHPVISEPQPGVTDSPHADPTAFIPHSPLGSPFAQPGRIIADLGFDLGHLSELRRMVAQEGARAGLSPQRVDDLVVAVNEIATNSIVHGGGRGVGRLWRDGADLVCEVKDAGVIVDPLADRTRPGPDPQDARGLWTANRLCDLVQVRSSVRDGSIIRIRMKIQGVAQ